jgi:ubiquitin conjugation factor E4 B
MFYGKVVDLLLNIVTDDAQNVQLPLANEVPSLWASYPEFVVEDMAELVLFCTQYAPAVLTKDAYTVRSIVNFLVVFLCSPNYISNPYLVAKLVEVVFVLHPSVQPATEGVFSQIIDHSQAVLHLAPALIQFYTAIETTGASSEFYDKFTIRYHLTIIFKSMWAHHVHKSSMTAALNSGGPFVRFVNLLINDTTFLLDESLECIKRIHETQQLVKSPDWARLGKEAQAAKKKQLASDESQCKSYMTLVNETLNLFHYITLEVKKPFLLPEIIGRLAAMLNCYVAQFCGPKYNDLNVENRDKYSFQPKTILNQITDLYLHLDSPELVQAVAADDRSYDQAVFSAALDRMRRTVLKPTSDLEQFERIAADAHTCYVNNLKEEADFDDAPEHYRDPITEAIMTDPVQLPSGKIMDRSCVTRILLDNAIDPFSRQPLSLDLVKDCPDLRHEIAAWKKTKLSGGAGGEPMS